MSRAVIHPARLSGTLAAPPSKSAAHRALICAALADGESRVSPLADSADMAATIGVLRAMGAEIAPSENGGVTISSGRWNREKMALLDCRESGSTLRFCSRSPARSVSPRRPPGADGCPSARSGRSWSR